MRTKINFDWLEEEDSETESLLDEPCPELDFLNAWSNIRPSGWHAPLPSEIIAGKKVEAAVQKRKTTPVNIGDTPSKKRRTFDKNSDDVLFETSDEEVYESRFEEELEALYCLAKKGASRPDVTEASEHCIGNEVDYDTLITRVRKNHPSGQAFDLKPQQREAIGQMRAAEESQYKAMILADDMGLGKTVQAIFHDGSRPHPSGSLFIVPASLINMWISMHRQIWGEERTIYHHKGNWDALRVSELEAYDVIIASYDQMREEYARFTEVTANYEHLRLEPTPKYREVIGRDGKVKHVEIHARKLRFPLFVKHWGRVILDEGHKIRNCKSNQHKAACALYASSRIILTETPFANDYPEIHAYFKFFNIAPLNNMNFFRSYFTRPAKSKKTGRLEIPLLKAMRGGVLRAAFSAIVLRREKDGYFEGKPLTSLGVPTVKDVMVSLDTSEKNPCRSNFDEFKNSSDGQIGELDYENENEEKDEEYNKLRELHSNPVSYKAIFMKLEDIMRNDASSMKTEDIVINDLISDIKRRQILEHLDMFQFNKLGKVSKISEGAWKDAKEMLEQATNPTSKKRKRRAKQETLEEKAKQETPNKKAKQGMSNNISDQMKSNSPQSTQDPTVKSKTTEATSGVSFNIKDPGSTTLENVDTVRSNYFASRLKVQIAHDKIYELQRSKQKKLDEKAVMKSSAISLLKKTEDNEAWLAHYHRKNERLDWWIKEHPDQDSELCFSDRDSDCEEYKEPSSVSRKMGILAGHLKADSFEEDADKGVGHALDDHSRREFQRFCSILDDISVPNLTGADYEDFICILLLQLMRLEPFLTV